MSRLLAITAMLALALPGLAAAQEHHQQHGGPQRGPARPNGVQHGGPVAGGPHRGPVGVQHGPVGVQHGGPVGPPHRGPVVAPHERAVITRGGPAGGAARPFVFHGHEIHRVHFARPWIYPPGWGYRRWAVGAVLPALFLAPAYYYANWAEVGLTPPPPGYQWIEYGPDLLLVNVITGQIVDVAYGVFY